MNAADIVFLGLRPSNFILILLIAGLVFAVIGLRRGGLVLMGVGVVAFVACGVLPVGQVLLRPLEARFPFQGTTEEPAGIILLGGAVEARKTHEHNQVTLNDRAERVIATASLARRNLGLPEEQPGPSVSAAVCTETEGPGCSSGKP
ncbi:MAG: hypothetical protein AAFW98_18760, partial [Pseudomonadota bacterium]